MVFLHPIRMLLGFSLMWSSMVHAKDHPGPLGLKWGKSPAVAVSVLRSKLSFIEEKAGKEDDYNTVDQRYGGVFAGLPTVDVKLKFHQGEFFYFAVILATAEAKSASKVWHDVVDKMTVAYGAPQRLVRPPLLSSGQAILQNLPIEGDKARVLALLSKGGTSSPEAKHDLLDMQIRTELWDPFAEWTFANDVLVQSFIHVERQQGKIVGPLMPVWIIVEMARFRSWDKEVKQSEIIRPRDY